MKTVSCVTYEHVDRIKFLQKQETQHLHYSSFKPQQLYSRECLKLTSCNNNIIVLLKSSTTAYILFGCNGPCKDTNNYYLTLYKQKSSTSLGILPSAFLCNQPVSCVFLKCISMLLMLVQPDFTVWMQQI